jgi:hypothetical protein
MRNPSTLGIVISPAPVAPLRELLVALLAGAVALRQLDWWKLLSRAGHLPTRRRQILVHVAAIGLTFTGTDASEEVAEDEESPLRSAMGHALLRVALEAMLFYTLLTLAIACGLSDGENGNHENDALAYLADTFVGGWGEPLLHAIGCVMFIAACEWVRGMIVAAVIATQNRDAVVASARRASEMPYRATTAHAPQTTSARTRATYNLPMKRSNRVVCEGSADRSSRYFIRLAMLP